MSLRPEPIADRVAEAAAELGELAHLDAALGSRTTYRVGGSAAILVEATCIDDLRQLANAVARSGLDTLVVGRGSNLLVLDGGFEGIAVALVGDFEDIAIDGTTVKAGGAASLPVVARKTAAAALTGFEWAVGVPGSVGGAVRMNAGGHGSDMAATLQRIRRWNLATGEDEQVSAADLELGYRCSAVRSTDVVIEAELRLEPGDRARSEGILREIVGWRRTHQPGGQNAGSVFTNPPGDSAGRLIDEAGCKGLRHGTAAVSDKHANFIQADTGGSADDIAALMARVGQRVCDHSGVVLHPETRIVGAARVDRTGGSGGRGDTAPS